MTVENNKYHYVYLQNVFHQIVGILLNCNQDLLVASTLEYLSDAHLATCVKVSFLLLHNISTEKVSVTSFKNN
jgi:hypothetical protein